MRKLNRLIFLLAGAAITALTVVWSQLDLFHSVWYYIASGCLWFLAILLMGLALAPWGDEP